MYDFLGDRQFTRLDHHQTDDDDDEVHYYLVVYPKKINIKSVVVDGINVVL